MDDEPTGDSDPPNGHAEELISEAPAPHEDDLDLSGADEETYDYGDEDSVAGEPGRRRRTSGSRREAWRTRSASGAIATAVALGLQQVFEPEKKKPAAVAEAPSDPYSEEDPITVDYVPDDAESTKVHVKPWLLDKEDPA